SRSIRVPVHVSENMSKLRKVVRVLMIELGRKPTVEEIALRADLPLQKVVLTLGAFRELLSLDSKLKEESDTVLSDVIEDSSTPHPESSAEEWLLVKQVDNLLSTLNERERVVIKMRYGLIDDTPKSLEELSHIMGVSRERIRQIECRAMTKLRRDVTARALLDTLN
ncbi:MAG TPA: sigma-70 family RNA polymerase sigma factor, partial [Chroococcales cyanobacterium]